LIYDVIIVGAGASGLCAAYQLAKEKSKWNILVIEKGHVAGRKLSASGNGKCNLTNQDFSAKHYNSSNPEFVAQWAEMTGYEKMLDFFKGLGILMYEKDGYYYPVSNQAKQVTETLQNLCSSFGVEFQFDAEVVAVKQDTSDDCYIVDADYLEKSEKQGKEQFKAYSVLLCTGGMAAPALGGTESGYRLTKQLGISMRPAYPALTPAYVEDKLLSVAKGVRIDAVITLRGDDTYVRKEKGQLQINDNSLSGIAMMNLSGEFNKWGKEERRDCLHIDTFPLLSWEELKQFFETQRGNLPDISVGAMMSGLFPLKFARYLLKRIGIDENTILRNVTDKQINRLTSNIKKLTFTPVKNEDYEKAQVTAGGVSVEEVSWETFECKWYPGLYIVGELLDVNGDCGGYNLTFAVLSGLQAAMHILKMKG
jgi:hypothetical protein